MMPIVTAGTIGVCVFGLTVASFSPNGSALSRAIAKVSRIAAVCTASAHTVTAMTMQTRKIRPTGPPITCSTMYCSPPELSPSCRILQVGRRHHREHQDRAADDERRQDRSRDRLRCGAPRLHGFLPERTGGVEAVHDVARSQRRDQEGTQEACALTGPVAVGGEEHLRPTVDVDGQNERDQNGGDQLDEDACAVDPRHQTARRAR